MKWPVCVLCSLVCLTGADNARRTDVQKDLQDFQGTWTVVSMDLDGKPLSQEKCKKIRLTIRGESFRFQNGDNGAGEPGLYKIDPAKDPKELNIVITEGQDKGKVYLVIYKFEDGKMIQCMEVSNQNRPKEFTGKPGSGCALEVWQREKP